MVGDARQAWRFQRSIVLESLKMNTPRRRELDLMWAAHVQGGIDGGRRIATLGRRGDSKKHRLRIIENEHAAQARAQLVHGGSAERRGPWQAWRIRTGPSIWLSLAHFARPSTFVKHLHGLKGGAPKVL